MNGNYALSDMVSALQWVQESIAVWLLPFRQFCFDPLINLGFRWRSLSCHNLWPERWSCCCTSNDLVAQGVRSLFWRNHGKRSYAAYVDGRTPKSTEVLANECLATYNVYLTLDQQIKAQTNTLLNATGCTNGSADAQVACVRAYTTLDLMGAGIANNVVVDGKYITQPYIYWNGTVRDDCSVSNRSSTNSRIIGSHQRGTNHVRRYAR